MSAPVGGWENYSTAFEAEWEVPDADWVDILSSVTLFGLLADAFNGADAIGIDNVNLESATTSAVPLPAGMELMLTGVFGLGTVKRRK
jgi:hypothetical protein